MDVHNGSTSVTMDRPNDTKTENGSPVKAVNSESSEDGPRDVGEHYMVRRNDDSWREYTQLAGCY